jgi:hypothetical protein
VPACLSRSAGGCGRHQWHLSQHQEHCRHWRLQLHLTVIEVQGLLTGAGNRTDMSWLFCGLDPVDLVCRGAYRAQRAIGERVPRYMKFLQV